MDDQGSLKKVWVEVELPEEEWLLECFNQTYIQVFKAGIRNKAEEFFEQFSKPASHPVAKIQTILYFSEKLAELAGCCEPSGSRHQSCQLCETTEEIYGWLMEYDFVGIEVSNITYGLPDNSFNNIVDYAGVIVDGVSLAQLVNETLGNIASSNNTSATGYITYNSSFCNGIADLVLVDYAADLGNFDVWVHLWDDTLNNVQIIFVRADFYMLYDDPTFIEYYNQSNDPTLQTLPGRSQDPEILYQIIDPENDLFYYSDEIAPLPIGPGDLQHGFLAPQPVHKVSLGDNLTKIVEEWGDGFTISDLIQWNPDKLVDENTILQIGWELNVYVDAFQDEIINEFYVWGYVVPILPLDNYNLISRNDHPDLGLIGVPLGSPVQNFKKPLRTNPTIKIPNPNGKPPVIKDPGRWDILKWFRTPTGKVILACGRVGSVFLSAMFTSQSFGNPSPLFYEPGYRYGYRVDDEKDDAKLTYVTYTKYNSKAQNNAPLASGKVYSGRTSGYNKNPLILIAKRDAAHKRDVKKDQYDNACYDHHEYSTKNSRATRHSDPAYKIIRGREQVIIENLGGAWSDIRKIASIRDTRSGNPINGIDRKKIPSFYNECKVRALNAAIILNPNNPPIEWIPICDNWQQY